MKACYVCIFFILLILWSIMSNTFNWYGKMRSPKLSLDYEMAKEDQKSDMARLLCNLH